MPPREDGPRRGGGPPPLRRGEDLSLDDVVVGRVYPAVIYSAHDLHGFFVHFGVVDDRGGEFRSFAAPGRITRSGLPASFLAFCEQRARDARRGGGGNAAVQPELLLPIKVKSVDRPAGGKPRVELMLVPTRKLLILDLNGVLFNRYPVGDERRVRKEVLKRPGCDAFLDFCFATFDVAAWSCCRRETLELGLFGEREKDLLFVNHSVHSTNLWPRHSVVSPDKPLFLKQLYRLWAEQFDRVAYDESNTILLDNHVEKFERNPLGTCIVVPEYVDGSDPPDAVLAPDGELTAHLRAMAEAPDSARYVRETASPFFPSAHPEPPCDVGGLVKSAMLETFCASACMRRELPDLTVQHYMEHHETPGPRAIQLRRKTLKEVTGPRAVPHVVCEKSDGTRLFLMVPEAALRAEIQQSGGGHAAAYFLDRHWGVEALAEGVGDATALLAALSPQGRTTLLDGELVTPLSSDDAAAPRQLFLVFDVIFLDGEDVGADPSLAARMEKLRGTLPGPLVVGFGPPRPPEAKVEVLPKVFYELADLPHLVATMISPKEGEAEEFVFDDGQRRSLSDGLVFTPSSLPYYLYQVHKYKTPGRISVDFKAKLADLRDHASSSARTAPLYLTVAKHDAKFTDLDLRPGNALSCLLEHLETEGKAECIVECDLARAGGLWVLRAIRGDKHKPNSLQTAWNNLEAISEGLDLDRVVAELERLRTAPVEDDDHDVAAHYDELQKKRVEQGEEALDPRIHNLRRLNNWIKSVLIETCAHGHLLAGGKGLGKEEKEADEGAVGDLPNPLATLASRNAAAAASSRARRKNERGSGFRVLDLACGRGGDVKKWMLQGAQVYVGVDVSSQSVAECQSRAEESQRRRGQPRVAVMLTRSMVDGDLVPAIEKALRQKGENEALFEIVSIQFAVHYAFDSEESLTQLLRNVGRLLVPGGQLILTSIDARCLRRHLQQHPEGEFGNPVYRVKFAPEALQAADGQVLDGLGLRYTFSLSSAVEACDEFVVHLPSLTRVAREVADLALVYERNFGQFVHDQLPAYGHLLEPLQVGLVSPEEWESVQLYSALVFQKGNS